jgi:hypothetical protein
MSNCVGVQNEKWPVKGWDSLFPTSIEKDGRALIKDQKNSIVYGMSYSIESEKLEINGKLQNSHTIRIDSWEYTVHCYGVERPVLSLQILDRHKKSSKDLDLVSNMKSIGITIPKTDMSTKRCLIATSYFIRQINKGFVPNIRRSLLMHKIHPSQVKIYREYQEEKNSIFQNLFSGMNEVNKSGKILTL